jgi:acyl-CoA oxidase
MILCPLESREFDIHTPTLTATKWWIGGAGQTATHAVVFARLITPADGDVGVHSFIVQIRSLVDHKPMKGVKVGDIGKKMGRNGLDNGWIQFNHVKIPHDQMLCRYASVSMEGKVSYFWLLNYFLIVYTRTL